LANSEITATEAESMLKAVEEEGPQAPKDVLATSRLKQDLYALRELLKANVTT
jgi:hypothetical protein